MYVNGLPRVPSLCKVFDHQRPALQRYKELAISKEADIKEKRRQRLESLRSYVNKRLEELEVRFKENVFCYYELECIVLKISDIFCFNSWG